MIKINLLPKTINQKAVLRNTAILFGVAVLVLIGAGVGYSFKLQSQVDAEVALAESTKVIEARVQAIQGQTTQLLALAQPMQLKLDFINQVLTYNLEYPKLYEKVARWTYEKAVLDSVTSDGVNVTMAARVKSLDDLGRYLLNMYCATDLFSEVQITQATGFGTRSEGGGDQGPQSMGSQIGGSQATLAGINAISGSVSKAPSTASWIGFSVVCKLKIPITPPIPPGAGAPPPGGPAANAMPSGGDFGGPGGDMGGPRGAAPSPNSPAAMEAQTGGMP